MFNDAAVAGPPSPVPFLPVTGNRRHLPGAQVESANALIVEIAKQRAVGAEDNPTGC
jgi:hypothetical protein